MILLFRGNVFPFFDILGYLKNTHKNPKFGKVRQVPTMEFPTKFPDWDLSHSSKFGIFVGILKNTLKYPKMGIGYFFLWMKHEARVFHMTSQPYLKIHCNKACKNNVFTAEMVNSSCKSLP